MVKLSSRSIYSVLLCTAVAVTFLAGSRASAQDSNPKVEVLTLVKEAMDAYSNLDLDTATDKLEEALGFAPDLDRPTLARLYVSYGVLWIGGFGDNAKGQHDFTIAMCLDPQIQVDPLLSSPEIDLVFKMAGQDKNDAKCESLFATIIVPGAGGGGGTAGHFQGDVVDPGVPPCGMHNAPAEQRQKYELPVYLELDPAMRGRVSRLVMKFAFDGGTAFAEVPFTMAGPGYGAQITCDEGQIRVYDPASIDYFIEGYDMRGNLVCGHASAQGPYVVSMMPDAAMVPGLPSKPAPAECTPCPPWDTTCGGAGLPGEGEPCSIATGCSEGYFCGDSGLCEGEGGGSTAGESPSKFYVNLGGGTGFGIMSQDLSFNKITTDEETGEWAIEEIKTTPSGAAWSGIPIRLAIGFFITPKLSLEATGRFDVTINSFSESQSCWDACNGETDCLENARCSDGPEEGVSEGDDEWEEAWKSAVALTDGNESVEHTETKMAWLANLRVRYALIQKGGLNISIFGGLGYGHIKYRVKGSDLDGDGKEDPYFPVPGFFNIELGPGLAYYFNRHFGLFAEVPIDLLVADGWALNFDVNVGLSFGF